MKKQSIEVLTNMQRYLKERRRHLNLVKDKLPKFFTRNDFRYALLDLAAKDKLLYSPGGYSLIQFKDRELRAILNIAVEISKQKGKATIFMKKEG